MVLKGGLICGGIFGVPNFGSKRASKMPLIRRRIKNKALSKPEIYNYISEHFERVLKSIL
jgi:hypothetical protein